MTWPAIVVWLATLVGLLLPGPLLLYIFAAVGALGTLQMLPIDINILPQVVVAAAIVIKVLLKPGNLARLCEAAVEPAQAALFTLFVMYALLSAFILPRIFSGQIEVIPIAGALEGISLLAPGSGNITQAGYLTATYVVLLVAVVLGQKPRMRIDLIKMMLVFGLALIASGLADLGTYSTGQSGLLEPFRNTSYRLLTDNESGGLKRLSGLTAEASVFGSLSVSTAAALIFLRPCCETARMRLVVGVTSLVLLALAALSTSSSAYAGLAVLAVVWGANWIARAASHRAIRRASLVWEAALVGGAVLAVAGLLVFEPQLLDPVYKVINVTVLEKQNSASYIERSMWTRVGFQAFIDSGGMGVGYGSLRTSNWFITILGSTGLFGGLLLFAFLGILLLRPVRTGDPGLRDIIRGLRLSLLPTSVMFWSAGTIPDIGVWNAWTYGIILGLLTSMPQRGPVAPAIAIAGVAEPRGRLAFREAAGVGPGERRHAHG